MFGGHCEPDPQTEPAGLGPQCAQCERELIAGSGDPEGVGGPSGRKTPGQFLDDAEDHSESVRAAVPDEGIRYSGRDGDHRRIRHDEVEAPLRKLRVGIGAGSEPDPGHHSTGRSCRREVRTAHRSCISKVIQNSPAIKSKFLAKRVRQGFWIAPKSLSTASVD